MWCYFLVIMALSALTVMSARRNFGLAMTTGWEDKGSLLNQKLSASRKARDDRYTGGSGYRRLAEDDGGRLLSEDNETQQERVGGLDDISVLYDAFESGNILSAAKLAKVIAFESAILDVPGWSTACRLAYAGNQSACASPSTVLNYLYTNPTKHQEQCEAGFCYAPSMMVSMCGVAPGLVWGEGFCRSRIFNWKTDGVLAPESQWGALINMSLCQEGDMMGTMQKRAMLPVAATCTPPSARYLRSAYTLGWPLAGYSGFTDYTGQFAALRGWFTTNARRPINQAIIANSATAPGARYYVGAPSGDKIISILMSSRLAQEWVATMMTDAILALFSFAFIFMFVWFHTGSVVLALAGLFEIIMSLPLALFCYRILMGQQNVTFMVTISIFLLLCIGADDIFVFTDCWKESANIPELTTKEERFAWTYRRAAGAMFTTTSTTAICLLMSAFAPLPQITGFGVFAALAVIMDYICVITWYPAVLMCYEAFCGGACCCMSCERKMCCQGGKPAEDGSTPERFIVRKMRATSEFIFKYRYLILVVLLALSAGAIATVALLAKPGQDLVFMESFTPSTKRTNVNRDEFYSAEDRKIQVNVMYGVDKSNPMTYPSSNQIIPTDTGSFVSNNENATCNYDTGFDWSPATQNQLIQDCEDAAANADMVPGNEVYCILNALRDYDPASFPYTSEAALRTALENFYATPQYASYQTNFSGYSYHTGFSPDSASGNGIKALWNSFNTTIPVNINPDPLVMQPHYDKWETYVAARPTASIAPFHSSSLWFMFNMLSALLSNALVTAGFAVAASFIILLMVTLNVWLSIIATICICVVILGVLAIVFLLGGALGMFECLVMILSIGLAVDYAVHITHFYSISKGTRKEKTTEALCGVGVSIIGGAITTMGAGLPLFFCAMTFFKLCGWFIFFTSLISLLASFGLLVPVLMIMGPEGDSGNLAVCFGCKKKGSASPAGKGELKGAPSSIEMAS